MKLLFLFIALNVVNVVLQTIKSLATVKCGKGVAAIVNALAYGLYTYVIIYTNADLPMFVKAFVVAITNLVGVYIVKALEEKMRKDKIWKIECTIEEKDRAEFVAALERENISYNEYVIDNKYRGFNVYSYSQKESEIIKIILEMCGGKYFASECKIL